MIDFNNLKFEDLDNFYGGNGTVEAKIFNDGLNRIMVSRLKKGVSIGKHTHTSSSEIVYVLSGKMKAIIDDKEEIVSKGECHYCPKGSSHTVINEDDEDLIVFINVPNQ